MKTVLSMAIACVFAFPAFADDLNLGNGSSAVVSPGHGPGGPGGPGHGPGGPGGPGNGPGFPGGPGNGPGGPGGPGFPGGPGHGGPGWGHQPPQVVCVAANRAGQRFLGRAFFVQRAQEEAIQNCRYGNRFLARSCRVIDCRNDYHR